MLKKNPKNELGEKNNKPLQAYSEKTKQEAWHLKAECDYTIASCTHTQKQTADLVKAYNLRAGIRNQEDHEHLTKTYGDEFPAKLTHIPLVKSMLDALLGLLREMPFNKHVTTADSHSYNDIQKRKNADLLKEINRRLAESQRRNMQQQQMGPGQPPLPDPLGEAELKNLQAYYKTKWKDKLEISGSHMLNYLRQQTKLEEKSEQMFENLFTGGGTYYRCKVEQIGVAPRFETLDPREVFYRKPRHIKYIKDCDRVRIRRMMPVTEVINRYGHQLSSDDLDKLLARLPSASTSQELYDTRLIEHGAGDAGSNYFIEVNECEWKSNNKIAIDARTGYELSESDEELLITSGRQKDVKYKFRLDLYQCTRIGNDIYTDMGRVKYIKRSSERPFYCELTVNGVINDDGNGNAYSLVLATESLQDKYDYMFMHWENLVALSGVKAIAWDFANIPLWMGDNQFDRIKKWLYYLKQGLALADTSDENPGGNQSKFAQTGEVDLSLNDSISVIIEMIQFIEETASRIIGVPRQMIGQITQYDGKATTEMAQASGTLTTKHLFMLQHDLLKCACEDLLNASRIAYKDGFQGAYVLGNGERVFFTTDAEDFTMADFGIFISDSGLEQQQLQQFQGLAAEFVKAQMIDAEAALDIVTVRSVAEMKNKLKEGVERQKENNVTQLQEQLQQAMQQIEQLTKQVQNHDQQALQVETQKVGILQQQADTQEEAAKAKAETDRAGVELDKQRVELEGLEVTYNKQNMEVRDK